ncbi:hypothetical protein ELI_1617 [Eubacterium callanderi]|uniref:Uncharacterized protein n=1 Tax=Eubacterium callanderi TaxID=53442 RepID=E3GM33_9FIRM|nr:hypothetical protein ELI_1617 [Eubacterium callanderi]
MTFLFSICLPLSMLMFLNRDKFFDILLLYQTIGYFERVD